MNNLTWKPRLFVSLLFFLCVLIITAQEQTIRGVVKDTRGVPIIGANVMVKGTSIGTATDLEGNYSLTVPSSANRLHVSYIGMREIEVPITGNVVNIIMEEDVSSLDELVVIGYGTVRKRDLTGSVASVRGESIKAAPVSNVAQALQGKLAGVNVISQDGRPDASFSIRVRGGGSISQSNEPLILIDGIQGNIGDIPADMIESIDVLKDASSTAIYGARGANGVILVTTRRGKEGKASVSYSGYAKFNTPTGYLDTFNPYDYLTYKWGLLDTYFGASYTEPFQRLFGLGSYAGNTSGIEAYKNVAPYNLQKEVYNSSFSHNHDLTVTTGTEKTKIIFGLNYTDEDGMKLNSYFRRATASFKLDQNISKNLDFNLDVRYTDRETMGNEGTTNGFGSSLSGAYRFRPIAVEDIKGDLTYLDHGSISGEEKFVMYDMFDPVAVIKDHENLTKGQSFRGTSGVNWTILNGLSYRTELTLARNYVQNENWRGPTPFGNEESYLDGNGKAVYAGDADYRKSDAWNLRWSNTLNYAMTLSEVHRVNFLAGQELTNSSGSFMRIQGERYPANFTRDNAFAMISQYGANLRISSGVTTPGRILSYFGRANYSLHDKYIITATFRADGSSTFSPEHRWGYFPAAALAWRVSEESFLEEADWLDDLKFRLSYGEVGNDAISADQWSQLWAASTDPRFQYGLNNEPYPSYDLASDQMANRDLKWETTITRNIGLDFTVLKNRLWGTIDLYKNTTKDLLMLTDIPSITGFNTSFANIGQTSNKGIEFSLSGEIFKNNDWNISASANINFNKGNIDKLAEGLQSAYGTQFLQSGIPSADYALLEGKPVGIVMGLKMDGKGYYTTSDFDYDAGTGMYSLKEGIPDLASSFVGFHGGIVPAGQYAYPGMPKFKDVSGGEGVPDGVLDEKDYVEIGRMVPIHTGGFNISVNYKKFDLGMFFNWSYGNDIYNANKLATLYNGEKGGGLYGNKLAIVNDTYKLYEIQNGNLVRLATPDQLDAANVHASLPLTYLKQGYVSNIGIEDGSYLRLNTLTLGYTLPRLLLDAVKINNIRLYGSIYNVFTLTSYSGLDPEVNTQQNANNARYPTPGFDWGTYPRSRQFVLGINATF
ncbi:SusC/RagA family TonB-linked outer membrane protein [Proteiniphilum sp. UBA1028]|jgi:TonB-linked SusC/RagA family outer membrane protein|uniref:SusC/RagA family TonB-linked outer membrane protein n=1 Tax=Proteiniphilum sp. UBA1028 TaxID=1947251 RepID=UPI0025E0A36E|nr:TonB-dependent receptor [Proteiniphilum sp. UBA1028]